jgi:parallel beta-helix repeat protein
MFLKGNLVIKLYNGGKNMQTKSLLKKGLVVGIILLLLSINAISIDARLINYNLNNTRNDTCFQRCFTPGTSKMIETNQLQARNHKNLARPTFENRSTIYVPDDYPTISSAVKNSSSGDTIIVRDGTYSDNVLVDKSLTIKSEYGLHYCGITDENTAVPIFNIVSNGVTIQGFTIYGKHACSDTQYGVVLNDNTEYGQIDSNYFKEFDYCIQITRSDHHVISNNLIGYEWACTYWGIWMFEADNVTIFRNTVTQCGAAGWGIHMKCCQNITIQDNKILANNYGILSVNSYDNFFINNTLTSNDHGAINLYGSKRTTIDKNTISSTNWDGIYLESSDNNSITNNNMSNNGIFICYSYSNSLSDNTVNGEPVLFLEQVSNQVTTNPYGEIILINCTNISIANSNISNIACGIELWGSNNITLTNCTVSDTVFQGIFLEYSGNNTITHATTLNSEMYDIALYDSCNYNIIKESMIYGAWWDGISLGSSNNSLYHNNFINNFVHIEGYSGNIMDAGYPSGGNYWSRASLVDKYYGVNQDQLGQDGIGEATVYGDRYPLMKPCTQLNVYSHGPYFALINDSITVSSTVFGGSSPYNHYWDLGDGTHSTMELLNHSYAKKGNYSISLTVTDSKNSSATSQTWARIKDHNSPPRTPIKPDGPVYCFNQHSFSYYTSTTDNDSGDWLYYMWDWGDGTSTKWIGPYQSGESIRMTHQWVATGHYSIRVKAWDRYNNGITSWSEPLDVYVNSISMNLYHIGPFLFAQYKNKGPYTIQNLNWTLRVTRSKGVILVFPSKSQGQILNELKPGDSLTIKDLILGLGKFNVYFNAVYLEISTNGIILGFVILF